jgi:uncharacterized repeat protein (TIGR01451 family)
VLIYVRLTIPTSATNGQKSIRILNPGTLLDTLTTTTVAPIIAVTFAHSFVSGIGSAANPAPGDVIRYTVTVSNTGAGTATNVGSFNTQGHLTTNVVVSNSFDIDTDGDGSFDITGVGDGYSSGGITVTVNGGTGQATVTFSSVPAGQNRAYRYNVTIQ